MRLRLNSIGLSALFLSLYWAGALQFQLSQPGPSANNVKSSFDSFAEAKTPKHRHNRQPLDTSPLRQNRQNGRHRYQAYYWRMFPGG